SSSSSSNCFAYSRVDGVHQLENIDIEVICMKKIMVVFTGGTIGSTKQSDAIDVSSSGSYMILEQYKELYGAQADAVEFHTVQPMNILSENLRADQWIELVQSIRNLMLGQYSGIIVTHGSDTFAY